MTVCIAVACESLTSTRFVVCADRLVTTNEGFTFEQNTPKFAMASPKCTNCLIMNAGNGNNADRLLQEAGIKIDKIISGEGRTLTIMEISKLLQTGIKELRKERVGLILNKHDLDLEGFYKNMKNYPEWFGKRIVDQISNYSLGAYFLILGYDIVQNGKKMIAHMNLIDSEGNIEILDASGFGILGIGGSMSLPEITKMSYTPKAPLSEAVVKVYWAKKSAERMVSVSHKTTDMACMWCEADANGNIVVKGVYLQQELLDELNRNYEESNKKVNNTIAEIGHTIDDIFSGKKNLSIA